MLKQRIAAVALIAASIYSVTIDGDATAAVVLIPLGLIALFTRAETGDSDD